MEPLRAKETISMKRQILFSGKKKIYCQFVICWISQIVVIAMSHIFLTMATMFLQTPPPPAPVPFEHVASPSRNSEASQQSRPSKEKLEEKFVC